MYTATLNSSAILVRRDSICASFCCPALLGMDSWIWTSGSCRTRGWGSPRSCRRRHPLPRRSVARGRRCRYGGVGNRHRHIHDEADASAGGFGYGDGGQETARARRWRYGSAGIRRRAGMTRRWIWAAAEKRPKFCVRQMGFQGK
jgi:hypothetical protein